MTNLAVRKLADGIGAGKAIAKLARCSGSDERAVDFCERLSVAGCFDSRNLGSGAGAKLLSKLNTSSLSFGNEDSARRASAQAMDRDGGAGRMVRSHLMKQGVL